MPLLHSSPQIKGLRRLTAEWLALAVRELFPKVLLVGGEDTDYGFFYDFIFTQQLSAHTLELIEVKMKSLIKDDLEVRSLSMMRENAYHFFHHHQQPILAERASAEELNIVSLIQITDFYDLCPALPVEEMEQVGVFKLLEVSEVPQHEFSSEREVVTRITGTAFEETYFLKQFLKAFDKLKKRDHRLLGMELDLFSFFPESGQLECYWHPKGETLCHLLRQLGNRLHLTLPAQVVKTPLLVKKSFGLQHNGRLLPPIDYEEEEYVLSQSRLFHHLQLFKRRPVSYLELPLRFIEWAQEYEACKKVNLWGLLRSHSFEVGRLTTFCIEEQVQAELISCLQFIEQIVRIFDFEGRWVITALTSSHPKARQEKQAVNWLTQALDSCHFAYLLDTQEGDHLLRGPRLEMRLVDSLGREWRGPSIEILAHSLGRFQLAYQAIEDEQKRPVILTVDLLGPLDRLVALLIEQFEGVFPIWLAPEQMRVVAIGVQNQAYAKAVYGRCCQQGFRAQLDVRHEKLGAKIHAAEKERIPYIIIVGDKEEIKHEVTIRAFQQRKADRMLSLDHFFEKVREEASFRF